MAEAAGVAEVVLLGPMADLAERSRALTSAVKKGRERMERVKVRSRTRPWRRLRLWIKSRSLSSSSFSRCRSRPSSRLLLARTRRCRLLLRLSPPWGLERRRSRC